MHNNLHLFWPIFDENHAVVLFAHYIWISLKPRWVGICVCSKSLSFVLRLIAGLVFWAWLLQNVEHYRPNIFCSSIKKGLSMTDVCLKYFNSEFHAFIMSYINHSILFLVTDISWLCQYYSLANSVANIREEN